MESSNTDYYLPKQIEENMKDRSEMVNGKYDAVKSLYDNAFTEFNVNGKNSNLSDPFQINV